MEKKEHKQCLRAPYDTEEFLPSDDYYSYISKFQYVMPMNERLIRIDFDPIEISENQKKTNSKTINTIPGPLFDENALIQQTQSANERIDLFLLGWGQMPEESEFLKTMSYKKLCDALLFKRYCKTLPVRPILSYDKDLISNTKEIPEIQELCQNKGYVKSAECSKLKSNKEELLNNYGSHQTIEMLINQREKMKKKNRDLTAQIERCKHQGDNMNGLDFNPNLVRK